MPKVIVDTELCESYGNCVMAAPEVFDLDNDGIVVLLKTEVPEEQLKQVEQAIHLCPVNALRLAGPDD